MDYLFELSTKFYLCGHTEGSWPDFCEMPCSPSVQADLSNMPCICSSLSIQDGFGTGGTQQPKCPSLLLVELPCRISHPPCLNLTQRASWKSSLVSTNSPAKMFLTSLAGTAGKVKPLGIIFFRLAPLLQSLPLGPLSQNQLDFVGRPSSTTASGSSTPKSTPACKQQMNSAQLHDTILTTYPSGHMPIHTKQSIQAMRLSLHRTDRPCINHYTEQIGHMPINTELTGHIPINTE